MKSIGSALAGASLVATEHQPLALPPEVQRFRVHLARFAFYEMEVFAETAADAMRIAELNPPSSPKLKFYTQPSAHSADVFQPWDQQWVKCPRE
ncbi:MAG: hypothetical protein WC661_22150 [Opitutaceae bacterium]|jgi:hypothetical protein